MRAFRRSLHYFEVVARTLSIRAAAEALHIAPSAVSRTVQMLEGEFGVALFERTARGLHLTAAGETVVSYMQRWKRETVQLADAVRSLTGERIETIRIATVEAASYELLPNVIGAVRGRVPGLSLALMVGDTQAVLESMLNGAADVGLVINMPKKVPVRSLWTMSNPVGLVVPARHRLASRRTIALVECMGEPLILPEEPLAARSAIRPALDVSGIFRMAATSNRIVAIKALLRAGLGVSFLTRVDIAPEVRSGEFCFIPLEDASIEHPYMSIVAPRNVKRTPAVDLVIEALRKAMPGEGFTG